MTANWSFNSARSNTGSGSAGSTPAAVSVSPSSRDVSAGDLLITTAGCRWATSVSGASATIGDNGGAGSTNTGSNPWVLHPGGLLTTGKLLSGFWWKLATSADTGSLSVTVTFSGGTGSVANYIELDDYSVPNAYAITGIDISGTATIPSSESAQTWTPTSGSRYSTFTDALALTSMYAPGNNNITGDNHFLNATTSTTYSLTVAETANESLLANQYALGVQADSLSANNTFKNKWTTALTNGTFYGATFVYSVSLKASIASSLNVTVVNPQDVAETSHIFGSLTVTLAVPHTLGFTSILLTGTYVTPDNASPNGSIVFQLTEEMRHATGGVITRTPQNVTVSNGSFSVFLLANNDPATEPPGVTYGVIEQIDDAPLRNYRILLPYDAPAGTINITDCVVT